MFWWFERDTNPDVATLIDRPVSWVEERLGQSGYPTYQRSSDRAQWVAPGDVAAWIDTEAPEPDVSPADQ